MFNREERVVLFAGATRITEDTYFAKLGGVIALVYPLNPEEWRVTIGTIKNGRFCEWGKSRITGKYNAFESAAEQLRKEARYAGQ